MIDFKPFELVKLLQQAKSIQNQSQDGWFICRWYLLNESDWSCGEPLSYKTRLSLAEIAEESWLEEFELLHSGYGLVVQTPHPSGKFLKVWKYPAYLKPV